MNKNNVKKHKVFISYYHADDQYDKDKFEELFGDIFINKSVSDGDIDDDVSADYIKRLIQVGYLTDTSVLIVLVGKNTYKRKHVDWEISAALSKKVGGYSGLLGLCLPDHPAYGKETYSEEDVPPRLVDNLKSGYAKFYDWTTSKEIMKSRIEEAFNARINRKDKIDDSREQFKKNRS